MAKKLKVPKRIAGVKIPKGIRKGPVADFMGSRAGQLVIAEALVAAGGVFTATKVDDNVSMSDLAKHPIDTSKRVAEDVTATGADQAQRLTFALKEAARAFRAAMEEGPPSHETRKPSAISSDTEVSGKKNPPLPESRAAHPTDRARDQGAG